MTKYHEISRIRLSQLVWFVGPAATLMVNPWTNYDPVSVPKMLVLSIVALGILGLFFSRKNLWQNQVPRLALYISAGFISWMILALLFSGADLSQQFWGYFGRNTGFLTYFSLSLILLGTISVSNLEFNVQLLKVFLVSSIPMTGYCIIQYLKLDPVPWSEHFTFGTLGNVNFLSAYLGMVCIGLIVWSTNSETRLFQRCSAIILAIVDFGLIISTGSIQGPIICIIGIAVFIFLKIRELNRFRRIAMLSYLAIMLVSISLLVLSLQDKGPLAKFIFQPSILYRADYIHAGWAMTINKPFFGVGLDSYGEWYRQLRGLISTRRTGPDRISNTAHNIFLDISSNGGIVLGLLYVSLVIYALFAAIRYLSRNKKSELYFNAFFSIWIAYQVQALVSINQLGVGIWGWLFTGVLIGTLKKDDFVEVGKEQKKQISKSRTAYKGSQLSPRDSIFLSLGLAVGFTLGVIPVNADMAYRKASASGNLAQIVEASNKLGSTQFHKELALDFAMRQNLADETKKIALDIVNRYPRNFFAWRVLSVATANTEQERQGAAAIVRSLDPFNQTLP